jgi:hypothetical protein
LLHQSLGAPGEAAVQDLPIRNPDLCLKIPFIGVEMRRWVVVEPHAYRDTME